MRFAFVSNYINHHQIPLANCMHEILGNNYRFIETQKMDGERIAMGWKKKSGDLAYVRRLFESEQECLRLIRDSDIVMFGGCEDESLIADRLEAGKPVWRYSERIYRCGRWRFVSPRGLLNKYHDHIRFGNSPVWLLCAGAYVAGDFSLIGAYKGKRFKWGYFPEFIDYGNKLSELISGKAGQQAIFGLNTAGDNTISKPGRKYGNTQSPSVILAVGRFLPLKHFETILLAAAKVARQGLNFELRLIGEGQSGQTLRRMAADRKLRLAGNVRFLGYMPPELVRREMEKADIFVLASDRREGWGAVLNEAMNSACVCLASSQAGATPFLIEHGINGFHFKARDASGLARLLANVLEKPALRREIAQKAYETIKNDWHPAVAAKRLLGLSKLLLDYAAGNCDIDSVKKVALAYGKGVGSPA